MRPILRPSKRRGFLLMVLGLAVVAVHLWHPDGLLGDLTYVAIACGAAAAAWSGAKRSGSGRLAVLVAVGLTLSATGDVIFQLYEWATGADPDVSAADVGWVGSYLAMGWALLTLLRSGGRRRRDLDGLIDAAAIFALATVVQWELFLGDLVADPSVAILPRVVWCLYPILDAVLLALVVRAASARRLRGRTARLTATGIAAWLMADLLFAALDPGATVSVWLDAGWLVGALLLAAAARSELGPPEVDHPVSDEPAVSRARAAIALAPLTVPPLFGVLGYLDDDDPGPLPLFGVTVVLLVIAYVRSMRSQRAEADARATVHSLARYAGAVAMNASDAVAVLDVDGRIQNDEDRLATMVGRPGMSPQGVDALSLVTEADVDGARTIFARSLSNPGRTFATELRVQHVSGERWLAVRFVNLLDDPDVRGVVLNLHDITDRKQVERELAHQAFHDKLTGLANRALFGDRVEQVLRRNSRSGDHAAVIYLDLDSFKHVNDSLGHAAGDELLQEVGRRLVDAVRTGDTVSRLGGDEFGILLEESRRAVDQAEAVADRILAALTSPIVAGERMVTVSASLGIAVAAADSTAASLLRDADVAMYRAKSAGKGRWVVYDSGMHTAAVERLQLESDLSSALARDQLRLFYQPVVELSSDRIVGFEALLRWDHPELGVLLPDRFIPIAEENGLIIPIGRWVLDEACRASVAWNQEFPAEEPLTMAVNITARQLADADLAADVDAATESAGMDPRLLVIELTESSLVHDAHLAARRLRELRSLGLRIAVDDFGTGYSSLSYLRQFPVDILKIDRSFVSTITDRSELPAIVRGLLDLGRTLGLEMVAEGVEDEVQRESLRDVHCDLAQGFLFARPLETADAEALLLRGVGQEVARPAAGS
jgi:diguanylate cyclase (GGDEF)-like protein/PAS domain S-box-containing protein